MSQACWVCRLHLSLLYAWLVHGFSCWIAGLYFRVSFASSQKASQWLLWFCVLMTCLFAPCFLPACPLWLFFLPAFDSLSLRPLSLLTFSPRHIFLAIICEKYRLLDLPFNYPWSLIMKPCLISHWISKFFLKATALWNLGLDLGSHGDILKIWAHYDTLLKQTFSISSCIWRWVWNRAWFSEDLSALTFSDLGTTPEFVPYLKL